MGRIGGIVLAAGNARRFGSDKRMARLADGATLLERSLAVLAGCVDDLVLVIGAGDDEAEFAARFPAARILRSARSAGGMGFALADAMARPPPWDGVLVTLADKPFVAPASARRVREELARHALVVPTYRGERGHPVGFGAALFLQLARLEGEAGARALIEAERARACFLELADPGIVIDIDTPEQLARAELPSGR